MTCPVGPLGRTYTSDDVFFGYLREFPNHLLQDAFYTIPIPRLQAILALCQKATNDLEEALASDPDAIDTGLGWEEFSNIKVSVSWLLGDYQSAERRARRSQRKRKYDLIAFTNLAFILRHTGRWPDLARANKLLVNMRRLRERCINGYAKLEAQSHATVLYLFRKCFFRLQPEMLMPHLEKLQSKPTFMNGSDVLIGVAMLILRYIQDEHTDMYPYAELTKVMTRAIGLFEKIKCGWDNTEFLRALAAAELGVIFDCKPLEKLWRVSHIEMENRRLNADGVFKTAMTLGSEFPTILTRFGRYFRSSDTFKSKDLLEKALALKPDARAHYYLGLTFKEMADEEIRRLEEESTSEPALEEHEGQTTHSPTKDQASKQNTDLVLHIPTEEQYKPRFSKDDMYIKDCIHHFKTALDMSHGEILSVSNDLGQLHRELGEFEDALLYFMGVLDRFSDPCNLTTTLEEVIIVYTLMLKIEMDQKKSEDLIKQKDTVMKMAVINQCQIRQHHYDMSPTSLKTLLSVIDQNYFSPSFLYPPLSREEEFPVPYTLQRIPYYALVREMREWTEAQLSDAVQMEDKIRMLLTEYRHDDAVLLLNLLTVTGQRPMMLTWKDADLYARSCVLAAGDRLWMCPVTSAERSLAKLFFRQAFNVFSTSHEGSGSGKVSYDQTTVNRLPGSEPPISPERADLQDAALADQAGTKPDGRKGRKSDQAGTNPDGRKERKSDQVGTKSDGRKGRKSDQVGTKPDGRKERKSDQAGTKPDSRKGRKSDQAGTKPDSRKGRKSDQAGTKPDGRKERKSDQAGTNPDGRKERKSDQAGTNPDGRKERKSDQAGTKPDGRKGRKSYQARTNPDGPKERKWHVQVLHDSGDTELGEEADGVTFVLRDVCGLTVTTEVTHTVKQMMTRAYILLFIVTQTDESGPGFVSTSPLKSSLANQRGGESKSAISPGYADLIKQAADQHNPATHSPPSERVPAKAKSGSSSRGPRDRVVVALFNNCPLPSALEGHRYFCFRHKLLRVARSPSGRKWDSYAVRSLFCSHLGIDM